MAQSADIQAYAAAHTTPFSSPIAAAAEGTLRHRSDRAGMMAGLIEGQLISALVAIANAHNVLEIGTFTGVGTLALAAGLRDGGQVTTLELDPDTAAVARDHIEASPWAGRINLLVGDARHTLVTLPGPFDLVWLDAAKAEYPEYWDAVRTKIAPGGMVAADNVLLGGRVTDAGDTSPEVIGVRAFNDRVHADPEFDNLLLDIGDGVLLAWRRG
jgi:caffeoyl-CoA O-methyltransferase